MKKVILTIFLSYFLIGFIWGMVDEMHLAQKYGRAPLSAFMDLYAYVRAVCFSPFWPQYIWWGLDH
jgi:hypothetical protein